MKGCWLLIDKIKSELEKIRKHKEQAVAQYNALMGDEQVLEKVITQAETPVTPETGEK